MEKERIKSIESCSRHSDDYETDQSRIGAKLRRLKIQEEILTTSTNKIALKFDMVDNGYTESVGLRNYLHKIKSTYTEIKTLYQDIKTITKDRHSLENTDIDDVRKYILELEKKMGALKEYSHTEIGLLKVAEKELLIQINESSDEKRFKNTRVATKPFSDVVPSPVRALINSPFKCIEVQRFQEFMKTNKRYGGWDEYNHNIFVHIWNKYYGDDVIENPDKKDPPYLKFKDEICMKIFGINSDDVHSHTQWYNEYLNLKKCQEAALNKWRENKHKIKCLHKVERDNVKNDILKLIKKNNAPAIFPQRGRSAKLSETEDEFSCDMYVSTVDESSSEKGVGIGGRIKQRSISHLYNSTKQWTRCQNNEINESRNNNIDGIEKLKIPSWRINL
ncbi:coiled-coil domain-containing protein 112-like isoform X1 [Pieris brassicae]|uniref:coiled-coil domain-containing protein 112-like isoform X1 n=1 Tax=Pieris brassicae TaxID=7116 RepID=UPI001E6615EB|nr:coiled-coil domain-containing protein 112-like isoform X1 [Pieris brassicae]